MRSDGGSRLREVWVNPPRYRLWRARQESPGPGTVTARSREGEPRVGDERTRYPVPAPSFRVLHLALAGCDGGADHDPRAGPYGGWTGPGSHGDLNDDSTACAGHAGALPGFYPASLPLAHVDLPCPFDHGPPRQEWLGGPPLAEGGGGLVSRPCLRNSPGGNATRRFFALDR